MKYLGIALISALLLVGCEVVQQAQRDYQTGVEMVAAGEIADPRIEAREKIETVLPFLPEPLKPVAYGFAGVLGALGLRSQGRKRRLNLPNPTSTAGVIGETAAEVVQGATELIGADHSVTRRSWKLAFLSSVPVMLLNVPGVQEWALANMGNLLLLVSGSTAALGGLEKALQQIKPTTAASTPPPKPVI